MEDDKKDWMDDTELDRKRIKEGALFYLFSLIAMLILGLLVGHFLF